MTDRPLLAANPKLDPAHSVLAWSLVATGDLGGAEEELGRVTVTSINPADIGFLHAKLGRRDAAIREIARLEMRGRAGFGVAYDQAIICAALGEIDRGCEALARAVEDHLIIKRLEWSARPDPRDIEPGGAAD